MGHLYVKEDEIFNTSRNGTVPKPTAQDVANNKVLCATGSWVAQSGGGGGGSGIGVYTGATPPTTDIGESGDLYFEIKNTMRYLRMTIYQLRGGTNITQLSDIRLSDGNNYYSFTNDTIAASSSGNPGEGVDMLIDNNVNTKYCTGYAPSFSNPLTITITFSNDVNIFDWNFFEYWTANDSSERDPVSFDVDISNDGTTFYNVLEVRSANITTSRKVLGYKGNIYKGIPYYKVGATWHKFTI